MKNMVCLFCALAVTTAYSATYYVDRNMPDDTGNGLSWGAAKRTIQAAINASTTGDTIKVGPGVYDEGTTVTPSGTLHNRIVCTKNITIESTEGAGATIIKGEFDTTGSGDAYGRGPNAVRCVYMTLGTLKGFTLTGGATAGENLENANNLGGGLYSSNVATPVLNDCIVSNNASHRGGGAYSGTFQRSLITANYASNNGGGVRRSRLFDSVITFNNGQGAVAYCSSNDVVNCTIAWNVHRGLEQAGAVNSIIVNNGSGNQGNFIVANCLIDFAPTAGYSINNITTSDARFLDAANNNFRLLADSPALDAADPALYGFAGAPASRTDFYDDPRVQGAELDIGAIEGAFAGAAVTAAAAGTGTLTPQGHFVLPILPTQLVFTATPGAGAALRHFTVNGAKMPDSGDTLTLDITRPGGYTIAAVFLATRYVDASDGDDGNDGETPATAWRTLQYAVDAAPLGGMVLAAPGIYAEGHYFNSSHSNRVSITRNVVLKGSAGAEQTFIVGKRDLDSGHPLGMGTNAMRCVHMSIGALEGFTLTGGASSVSANDADGEPVRGGGLRVANQNIEVWDCIISNNVASRGSASFGGAFRRCLITGNTTFNNGTFRDARVENSLVVNNTGGNWAFAFSGNHLYNCTVSGNSNGGLSSQVRAYNSIIYGNSGSEVESGAVLTNCLTSGTVPRPGLGNIAGDPLFVDAAGGDYRLRADSPCVDAGSTDYVAFPDGTDYAGAPRVQGNGVNMGALETAVSVVTATSSSGGAIAPEGTFLFTGDLTFTATPWTGRAFRRFEINGEPVPGSDTNLTINADTFSGDSAVNVHAVFQDGYYVDAVNGDDGNSGLEPEVPLQTLQAAVDLALEGDTVRVAAGVYQAAGRPAFEGGLTNRLVITNNITVTALDGPTNTFIIGARSINPDGCGPDAIRCVYMSAGSLEGFTLTGGATDAVDGGTQEDPLENDCGGGLYALNNTAARAVGCVISNNIAFMKGGGISRGWIHRCWIEDNDIIDAGGFGACVRGGAVYDSVVVNSSIRPVVSYAYVYNSTVYSPAAVTYCSLRNCIAIRTTGESVYYSADPTLKAYNSCLTGSLSSTYDGGGNIFTDPLFIDASAKNFRLHSGSPCIDSGSNANYVNGLGFDYTGATRLQGNNIDMGAYEGGLGGLYVLAEAEGGGVISPEGLVYIESVPASETFTATPWLGREFLHFSTNGVPVTYSGDSITIGTEDALSVNLKAHFAGTVYADAAKPDDTGDGFSWETAKRTLQAAVGIATDNDTVLVAPGVYDEGTAVTPNDKDAGYILNRVVITNDITLRSRDGSESTIIKGAFDTTSGDSVGRGPDAVRGVFMSQGVLEGFTVTGGATDRVDLENENNRGGGIYVTEGNYVPLVLDCIITNNASVRGGGIHAGTLKRCLLAYNWATNNSSAIRGSIAYDCLVIKNLTASPTTGSACGYAWLYNCTIADNEGRSGDVTFFRNCILDGGQSLSGRHYDCCLNVETSGASTIVDNCVIADPLFVDAAMGDYRLAAGSPCIDRANHAYVDDRFGTDFAGDLRMQNARVDVGAYEYDWRPAFAAALDGSGITVTDITPFVTYAEDSGYFGGSAVYLDGAAAQADGFSSVGMTAPWNVPHGRTVWLAYAVTGTGTLGVYDGETLIDEVDQTDGQIALKYTTAVQNPFPLSFVYTAGTGDTGGALLDAFEGTGGLIIMLR